MTTSLREKALRGPRIAVGLDSVPTINMTGDIEPGMEATRIRNGQLLLNCAVAAGIVSGDWTCEYVRTHDNHARSRFQVKKVFKDDRCLTLWLRSGQPDTQWEVTLHVPDNWDFASVVDALRCIPKDAEVPYVLSATDQASLPRPTQKQIDTAAAKVSKFSEELGIIAADAPVHTGQLVFTTTTWITPEMAGHWLTYCNESNRKKYPTWIDRLALDMEKGLWFFTSQPAIFSDNKVLLDKQHTLEAILRNGQPQMMTVNFNVPTTAHRGLDQIRPRTALDMDTILGTDLGKNGQALLRRFLLGMKFNAPVPSANVCIEEVLKHHKAYQWTRRVLANAPAFSRRAPVAAALMRAWYYEPREKLENFAIMLTDLTCNHRRRHEAPILKYLMRHIQLKNKGGSADANLYAKVTRCISYYVSGKLVRNFNPDRTDRYPLPDDPDATIRERNRKLRRPRTVGK